MTISWVAIAGAAPTPPTNANPINTTRHLFMTASFPRAPQYANGQTRK